MSPRWILVALVSLLPAGRIKNVMLRRLGWVIGSGAEIGPCLIIRLDKVCLGDNTRIGPFNLVKDLSTLELQDNARLGHFNWLSSARSMRVAGASGDLRLGVHTSVTSRHYLDCTGGIRVGSFTQIAGGRSTFLTHGISWVSSDQVYQPISVGDYCLISSNVQIAPGTVIGDRVVLGMGATASGDLREAGLYVQPRAGLVKGDLDGKFFERKSGGVNTYRGRH